MKAQNVANNTREKIIELHYEQNTINHFYYTFCKKHHIAFPPRGVSFLIFGRGPPVLDDIKSCIASRNIDGQVGS